MAVVRPIINTGDPLIGPGGSPLGNVRVSFTIVDANGDPTDVWDAITHERVVGVTYVKTGVDGIFPAFSLWPTSRGNKVTQYLCHVESPGATDFIASLPEGDLSPITWIDFAANGAALVPADLSGLYVPHSMALAADDMLFGTVGAWVRKTLAQAKTALGINNVDNTSDVNKPVSTAQALADAAVLTAANAYADNKIPLTQRGAANGVATLDAGGLVPITQLPQAAMERLVIVANQAARYALTTASVQNGDTVKQVDTNTLYYVVDDTNLGNASGYEVYAAGTAAAVAWGGITGRPAAVDALSGTNTGDETATSIGSLISGATETVTPVDADTLAVRNASSGLLNKLTFANLWVWIAAKLFAGSYIKNVILTGTTTSGTKVFTAEEAYCTEFEATGAVTANVIYEFPVGSTVKTAENKTTGAFLVQCRVTGGSLVTLPRGKKLGVYTNGLEFEIQDSRLTAITMSQLAALDATLVSPYIDQYVITDYPNNPAAVVSNGTKWVTVGYNPQLKTEASPGSSSSTTFNDASIVKSFAAFPAGFLKIGDTITVQGSVTKNNTTNAETYATYIGTTGTISGGDTAIFTSGAGAILTTQQNLPPTFVSFVIVSNTTVAVIQSTSGIYQALTDATRVVTIPDISANALIISVAIKQDTSNATTSTMRQSFLSVIKQ